MNGRCCGVITLILFVVLSFGCNVSLQSSQYAFVKNLFKAEAPSAEKNWNVLWGNRVYPVYAINHGGGVYFADESGFVVTFEGSQVTSLSLQGFKNRKIVRITKTILGDGKISLQFQNQDGRNVGTHLCSPWQLIASQDASRGWDQECVDGSGKYTNEIRENVHGQIVALKQVIVPGDDPIVIAQLL